MLNREYYTVIPENSDYENDSTWGLFKTETEAVKDFEKSFDGLGKDKNYLICKLVPILRIRGIIQVEEINRSKDRVPTS